MCIKPRTCILHLTHAQLRLKGEAHTGETMTGPTRKPNRTKRRANSSCRVTHLNLGKCCPALRSITPTMFNQICHLSLMPVHDFIEGGSELFYLTHVLRSVVLVIIQDRHCLSSCQLPEDHGEGKDVDGSVIGLNSTYVKDHHRGHVPAFSTRI